MQEAWPVEVAFLLGPSETSDQFQERLGIAPNVLSERLARLVDAGVLDLYPMPLAMLTWGDRWLSDGRPEDERHRTARRHP